MDWTSHSRYHITSYIITDNEAYKLLDNKDDHCVSSVMTLGWLKVVNILKDNENDRTFTDIALQQEIILATWNVNTAGKLYKTS